jgi:hypothetical protein
VCNIFLIECLKFCSTSNYFIKKEKEKGVHLKHNIIYIKNVMKRHVKLKIVIS